MAHVHAENMRLYADDAAETDKPWERWETKTGASNWVQLSIQPNWFPESIYRRKPRTININGYLIPEPIREAPKEGAFVYYTDVTHQCVGCRPFSGGTALLKSGFLHRTQEAAQLHLDALLSFTRRDEE